MPPVGGACGAGAVVARPGSQGGSRDFLLEEAALWQLPVGDGGGGWGKGPPAFIETRWRGAGSAGAGGRREGAPLPHPDYSAANPSAGAAPGEARGPCAVTAPHCLQQPPSMAFCPGRRLSRDHRDAATGAELRSVPAVPPRGPHVPDAQGNGRTPSPGPPKLGSPSAGQRNGDLMLDKVPAALQDPCLALLLARQCFARSSRRCSPASCPKPAPKPRCADEYPCGSSLPGAETSPTHHISYVVLEPC